MMSICKGIVEGEMKAASIASVLFALSIGAGTAAAAPPQAEVEGDGLVTKVQIDCHADMRRHFLPQYGERLWHRHRQSNCRIVLAEPEDDDYDRRDCHRDVRRHFLPEYGRRVYHKHVGSSCRIRIYNQRDGGGQGGNCIRIGVVTLCEN